MKFGDSLVNNMTMREVGRFIDTVDPETLRGLYWAAVEYIEAQEKYLKDLGEENDHLLDEIIGYQQEVWELQQEIKE